MEKRRKAAYVRCLNADGPAEVAKECGCSSGTRVCNIPAESAHPPDPQYGHRKSRGQNSGPLSETLCAFQKLFIGRALLALSLSFIIFRRTFRGLGGPCKHSTHSELEHRKLGELGVDPGDQSLGEGQVRLDLSYNYYVVLAFTVSTGRGPVIQNNRSQGAPSGSLTVALAVGALTPGILASLSLPAIID